MSIIATHLQKVHASNRLEVAHTISACPKKAKAKGAPATRCNPWVLDLTITKEGIAFFALRKKWVLAPRLVKR